MRRLISLKKYNIIIECIDNSNNCYSRIYISDGEIILKVDNSEFNSLIKLSEDALDINADSVVLESNEMELNAKVDMFVNNNTVFKLQQDTVEFVGSNVFFNAENIFDIMAAKIKCY